MGDLIQFPKNYRRFNNFQGKTYDYILLLVDCFSKKIWARPLTKKTKEESSVALMSIFDTMKYKPTMFVTDDGKGLFYSKIDKLIFRIFQFRRQEID